MANIDLNKLFTKQHITTSPVDSEIGLNRAINNEVLFSDVKFDLEVSQFLEKALNSKKSDNDIQQIINEESILNSLRNILSTTFCSRLLNPEINFDLRDYLFETITEAKAYFIGYKISTYLPIYEPRVEIKNIHVTAYYNQDAYTIELQLYIPSIDKNIKLHSILNSDRNHL
ncbi:MAG: hypothetical protein IJ341_12620 [Bacteroidales bacterium]|nr:hypothetical protein [Bacteroidales bacterium]